jgi:hypothetical protein
LQSFPATPLKFLHFSCQTATDNSGTTARKQRNNSDISATNSGRISDLFATYSVSPEPATEGRRTLFVLSPADVKPLPATGLQPGLHAGAQPSPARRLSADYGRSPHHMIRLHSEPLQSFGAGDRLWSGGINNQSGEGTTKRSPALALHLLIVPVRMPDYPHAIAERRIRG